MVLSVTPVPLPWEGARLNQDQEKEIPLPRYWFPSLVIHGISQAEAVSSIASSSDFQVKHLC